MQPVSPLQTEIVTAVHAQPDGVGAKPVVAERWILHRKLGLVSFALWPVNVATMTILVKLLWLRVASAPPGPVPPQVKTLLSNVLLDQLNEGLLIAVFIGWAILVRRKDPEAHKRLMILGTLMLLPAAIDRIAGQWLPALLLGHYNPQYALLWLTPALASAPKLMVQ